MPIFKIELRMPLVVEAPNINLAHAEAATTANILDAADSAIVEECSEVTRLDQLEDGWDGECLPFGGDGCTRLKHILI